MKTILKYPLQIMHAQDVLLPRNFVPLTVQVQDGRPMLWARVDTDEPHLAMPVTMLDTGGPFTVDDDDYYVGTVQISGFVWHYYVGRRS